MDTHLRRGVFPRGRNLLQYPLDVPVNLRVVRGVVELDVVNRHRAVEPVGKLPGGELREVAKQVNFIERLVLKERLDGTSPIASR